MATSLLKCSMNVFREKGVLDWSSAIVTPRGFRLKISRIMCSMYFCFSRGRIDSIFSSGSISGTMIEVTSFSHWNVQWTVTLTCSTYMLNVSAQHFISLMAEISLRKWFRDVERSSARENCSIRGSNQVRPAPDTQNLPRMWSRSASP